MQNVLDQFPVQESYINPNQVKMENPQKRARSDDISEKDMLSFHGQFPVQESYIASGVPSKIENVLEQLEQDVTSIKSNLEKKRSKVTISTLNEKVDQILLILKKWEA